MRFEQNIKYDLYLTINYGVESLEVIINENSTENIKKYYRTFKTKITNFSQKTYQKLKILKVNKNLIFSRKYVKASANFKTKTVTHSMILLTFSVASDMDI